MPNQDHRETSWIETEQTCFVDEWSDVPATEEECSHDCTRGKHVGVFSKVEQSELHTGVLGVIPAYELWLGLGKVERGAVGFCECGNEEDEEGKGLVQYVPTVCCLPLNDFNEVE